VINAMVDHGGELLVRCAGMAKTYGRGSAAVVAVHAASCAVAVDDRIAVTGPSGSGKSTLLHLLAGLDQPTAGTISWPGLDGNPAERPAVVGFVFQGPSLLPPLDVLENVTLPLLLAGTEPAEARDRAEQALVAVDLAGLRGALPEELSGGQAQRVAVARVLAARPRLILADEPTGQLDAAHRDHVVAVLVEAARQLGAGLVVATHDPQVAGRLDRQWRMRDGRLHTDDPRANGPVNPPVGAEEEPCSS
jgi:putative ABC transport system ATP-binding protein